VRHRLKWRGRLAQGSRLQMSPVLSLPWLHGAHRKAASEVSDESSANPQELVQASPGGAAGGGDAGRPAGAA